jgi:hypothetical protein
VPNARVKGEHRLDHALAALRSALRAARAPWMVIGGIAVIARGVRRLTTDIDVVVRGDAIGIEALLEALESHEIAPRVDDARSFASEHLVLLLRHLPSGVNVDLSLAWTTFELEAIAASTKVRYGSSDYPTARAEDLIIFKTVAARPRDLEDAVALWLMHPDVDRVRIRSRLAELARLADEPGLVNALEGVMTQVDAVLPPKHDQSSSARARPKTARRRATSRR